MNVRFGDWELRKMDATNWELYHLGVCVGRGSNNSDGRPRWRGVGRYYQSSTFHLALEYAADWEMRNGDAEACAEMGEYLRIYFEKLERFRTAFNESVLAN